MVYSKAGCLVTTNNTVFGSPLNDSTLHIPISGKATTAFYSWQEYSSIFVGQRIYKSILQAVAPILIDTEDWSDEWFNFLRVRANNSRISFESLQQVLEMQNKTMTDISKSFTTSIVENEPSTMSYVLIAMNITSFIITIVFAVAYLYNQSKKHRKYKKVYKIQKIKQVDPNPDPIVDNPQTITSIPLITAKTSVTTFKPPDIYPRLSDINRALSKAEINKAL